MNILAKSAGSPALFPATHDGRAALCSLLFANAYTLAGNLLTLIRERAMKGAVFLPVQVRPGELSVHPSSYHGDQSGNCLIEAHGTVAHLGWVCKPTGRNVCEARAGLEREVVSADRPELPGRPLDHMGATDR